MTTEQTRRTNQQSERVSNTNTRMKIGIRHKQIQHVRGSPEAAQEQSTRFKSDLGPEPLHASREPSDDPILAAQRHSEIMAGFKIMEERFHRQEQLFTRFEHRLHRLEEMAHLNNDLLLAQHRHLSNPTANPYMGLSDETLSTFFGHHGVYNINANAHSLVHTNNNNTSNFEVDQEGAGGSQRGGSC